jgi:carbonic anhydrase
MRFSLLVLGLVIGCVQSLTYNYSAQTSWPSGCTEGADQSPINITGAQYSSVADIVGNWPSAGAAANASNTEQTIQIVMTDPSKSYLQTVPMEDEQTSYYLHHIEFHFGSSNDVGSPHSVDGVHYPLEVHFTFYNSEKDSYSAASTASGGIVTYAVFYSNATTGSSTLTSILSLLNSSTLFDGDSSVDMGTINYTALLPSNYQSKFYYYEGSFVFPDCSENVKWIIANETMPVSVSQLATLRTFSISSGGSTLAPNYREIQSTGQRIIHKSFKSGIAEAGPTGNSYILALFFIFSALICVGVAVTVSALKSRQYHVVDDVPH